MSDETARDWRGTPITPGALVIYGAPVGRSIAMVEATVADPMLTKSGRIWLNVVRRSYGGWGDADKPVHVGADRLTVVAALPSSSAPTEAEKRAEERARAAEVERIRATHTIEHDEYWFTAKCTVCHLERRDLILKECLP